jgi:hypothetical protein
VWKCLDQLTGTHVALKIQKSAEHYKQAALDEIKLLECAESGGEPGRKTCVVKLISHFEHTGVNGRRKYFPPTRSLFPLPFCSLAAVCRHVHGFRTSRR